MNKRDPKSSVIVLMCAVFLAGCGDEGTVTSHTSVVGEYRGRYRGGYETIDLHADGTFIQEFRQYDKTVVYTNKGKWVMPSPNDIRLEPFVGNIDPSEANTKKFKTNAVAAAVYRYDPARIEFGDWPYFVQKMR